MIILGKFSLNFLQKSLTPHPQPLPLVRGGERLCQQMRGEVLLWKRFIAIVVTEVPTDTAEVPTDMTEVPTDTTEVPTVAAFGCSEY
ncbi:hypothetical protein FACHB389_32050 [Nostoc calcicola FACHB-389]|nr:hypothetical protein FACHB389_32050 [Nostoc calcicola FACHB-389]